MIVRAVEEQELVGEVRPWDPRAAEQTSPARLAYPVVRRIVAEGFDVREESFLDHSSRTNQVTRPRFGLVFWVRAFCKEPGQTCTGRVLPMSYPSIAARLELMDHTTVISAQKRARVLWDTDPTFARNMDRCWERFQEVIHAG
jgi:chromosomal replication initiation ATPase DnaA